MSFSTLLLVLFLSQTQAFHNLSDPLQVLRIFDVLLSQTHTPGFELLLISSQLPTKFQFFESLNGKSLTLQSFRNREQEESDQLYHLLSRIYSNQEQEHDCLKLYIVIAPADYLRLVGILKMVRVSFLFLFVAW